MNVIKTRGASLIWDEPGGDLLTVQLRELRPVLRGWVGYYRLSQVKAAFQELDIWLRRRSWCIIWRQWKTSRTRFNKLRAHGVNQPKAARAAWGRDGPWSSARGSAINLAYPNRALSEVGLLSFVDLHHRLSFSG